MKSLNVTNPITNFKKFMILALFLVASLYGSAQERAQADVSITAVNLSAAKPPRDIKVAAGSEFLKCSITVFSHNDDDAQQIMLVVVVPVEVSIVSNPSNAKVITAGGTSPFAGYLIFSLGNMAVGQSITVEFTFTKSVYGNKVGAYAYSASPDPNPANNYKDATY